MKAKATIAKQPNPPLTQPSKEAMESAAKMVVVEAQRDVQRKAQEQNKS